MNDNVREYALRSRGSPYDEIHVNRCDGCGLRWVVPFASYEVGTCPLCSTTRRARDAERRLDCGRGEGRHDCLSDGNPCKRCQLAWAQEALERERSTSKGLSDKNYRQRLRLQQMEALVNLMRADWRREHPLGSRPLDHDLPADDIKVVFAGACAALNALSAALDRLHYKELGR
jgi:hypothetical protein